MANGFDLMSGAPSLGAGTSTQASDIPWEQVLANRRQFTPDEIFGGILQYLLNLRGGGRRSAAGFIQAPTESQQVAEENAAWEARFPRDRQEQAVAKEKAAFGDRLPSFTEQETASRSMTPQERINQRMGGGWAGLSPAQRRQVLQQQLGQRPDMVDPTTGRRTSQTPGYATANPAGPSMIDGMPAQQAIAQATQRADAATAGAGRRAAQAQEQNRQQFRRRNPQMSQNIRRDVLAMFR